MCCEGLNDGHGCLCRLGAFQVSGKPIKAFCSNSLWGDCRVLEFCLWHCINFGVMVFNFQN